MQYLYHKPRISRSKMVERIEYSNESPGVSTSGMNEIIAWLRWEKKSACLPACGRPGFDPRVGKIPRRREWQSTPVFLPRESHGQRRAWCHSFALLSIMLCICTFTLILDFFLLSDTLTFLSFSHIYRKFGILSNQK